MVTRTRRRTRRDTSSRRSNRTPGSIEKIPSTRYAELLYEADFARRMTFGLRRQPQIAEIQDHWVNYRFERPCRPCHRATLILRRKDELGCLHEIANIRIQVLDRKISSDAALSRWRDLLPTLQHLQHLFVAA